MDSTRVAVAFIVDAGTRRGKRRGSRRDPSAALLPWNWKPQQQQRAAA
jgi:hypothetical protein